MNTATPLQTKKARYIVNLVKSVDKDINHALYIVGWYCDTPSEEIVLSDLIVKLF